MSELVSIITPSYNTAQFIGDTINCVLAQTYTNWEMIIVDDCSFDNTDDVVAAYHDHRIIYMKNKKNIGAALSRNKALRKAKGKWIAFLDSDDLWSPNKLENQICFMKQNGYYFSYTNYTEIDENGQSLQALWTGPKKISKVGMLTFNYMGCLTVMYDREYVGLIQIPDLKKRNDYAMWIKVSKKCPAYLLNENLAKYRIRKSGSVMNRSKSPLRRMKYNYELFRKSEKMNVISAGLMMSVNAIFGVLKKIIFKTVLNDLT